MGHVSANDLHWKTERTLWMYIHFQKGKMFNSIYFAQGNDRAAEPHVNGQMVTDAPPDAGDDGDDEQTDGNEPPVPPSTATWVTGAAAVAAGAYAAPVATVAAVQAIGFTPTGITGGSFAASMMSASASASGGGVASMANYGLVATLQSVGATGALPAVAVAGTAIVGGAVVYLGSYAYRRLFPAKLAGPPTRNAP